MPASRDPAELEARRLERVPQLIHQLYAAVDELGELYPGRHFTPDGHLVGSIGEVLAAAEFDLVLATASTEGHDATTRDGRLKVEIKATSGTAIRVGVGLVEHSDRLVALKLDREGHHEVLYNGPSALVWAAAGKPQKNGQQAVSVSTLRRIDRDVPEVDRLPRQHRLA